MKSRVAAVTAGAVVVVGLGAGGAVAGQMITGADIRNGSVKGVDVGTDTLGRRQLRPNSVGSDQLSDWVMGKVGEGSTGLKNIESDGPYPGSTDLGKMDGQGDNSDEAVPADGQRHTVWVQCAPGKVALGGGFRLAADNTQAAAEAISVLASEPTQIKDGAVVYEPIEGDEAGSFQANGWLVEVVNHGAQSQTVRPWVTCADADS
jgi:hypothetical protein